jgi:hypothetical protein
MATYTASHGDHTITDLVGPCSPLVRVLTDAYWEEIETASNSLTSSTNRDGIHAVRIASSLREAITCALDHAHRLAIRIKQVHGPMRGPEDFSARPLFRQAPSGSQDNLSVLTDMVEAQIAAVDRYRQIAAVASDALDWITRDLAIRLIREKKTHLRVLQNHRVEVQVS